MTGLQRKERPIIFSGSSVRAILDGRKTVTRRVVKTDLACNLDEPRGQADVDAGYPFVDTENGYVSLVQLCPYGHPGELLWVRESFWGCDLPGYGDQPCVVYDDEWEGKEYRPTESRPWARKFGRIPSIHMPRECSRILLEITDVRVERLQAISEEQAIAEGPPGLAFPAPPGSYWVTDDGRRKAFRAIWESINGAGSWDANPWVWAISFKRIQP